MSTRTLSIILVGLLVVAVLLTGRLLIVGPERVEEQSLSLFQAQQKLLADQGTERISETLRDLRVRLEALVSQIRSDLNEATTDEDVQEILNEAARQFGRDSERYFGTALALLERDGELVAATPKTEKRRLETSLETPLSMPSPEESEAADVCRACLSGDRSIFRVCGDCLSLERSILLVTELDGGRMFAAKIDLNEVARQVFEKSTTNGERYVAFVDENGETVFESGAIPIRPATTWIKAEDRLPGSAWRVRVEAPKTVISRGIRSTVSEVLYATAGVLILLVVGLGIFGILKRRELREQRERTQFLAHQDKLATLGMLAASTSHEIRNAITAAQMRLEVVKQITQGRGDEHVERARAAIDRLEKLANNLSRYGGREVREIRYFHLGASIEDALDIVEPKIKDRVSIEYQKEAQATVRGSKSALTQVLVNLILNAYDAVEDCENPRIDVRLWSDGRRASVAVTDNGPGVDEETIARIFEPFFTTKESAGGKTGGSGIGLWLSSQIAEQHNGSIDVENVEGKGACFTLSIPTADDVPGMTGQGESDADSDISDRPAQ